MGVISLQISYISTHLATLKRI